MHTTNQRDKTQIKPTKKSSIDGLGHVLCRGQATSEKPQKKQKPGHVVTAIQRNTKRGVVFLNLSDGSSQ